MDQVKVYSYLRFSDPRQSTGTSIERQTQYARQWAAVHGLKLDESLSLRDEGLSAYHQKHIKQGALGTFLEAVQDGLIAEGSVLIVESLDRLSRAEPILAQGQLSLIINAGITVVTASDNKEYNREKLKANPMDLVYSLLVMIRAHEESDIKSKRVKAALKSRLKGWIDGTYRGRIAAGSTPQWLSWSTDHWEVITDRAQAYQIAVKLYRQGKTSKSIIFHLKNLGLAMNENGLPKPNNLATLLRNPALTGVKIVSVDGEKFELNDYYPALISNRDRKSLFLPRHKRHRKPDDIASVVTGSKLLRCGYCDSAVVGGNSLQRKRRPNGTPQDGHRRLHCCGNNKPKRRRCTTSASCSVVPVENAIMAYCSHSQSLQPSHEAPNTTLHENWAQLMDGVNSLDFDAREMAQYLIKETFQKIIIYMNGFTPTKANGPIHTQPPIDLTLIPKHGEPKSLHINRKTGEWVIDNSTINQSHSVAVFHQAVESDESTNSDT
ncbi:recombinase family protein [Chromobacterium violaceum]|uniref:recombinase family protein n=1 Tax=Chromobacterium violaceum TaxID=536 RepID=UPI0005B9CF72|nr:recombinase family protein [Chromobacterium violaceum]